MTYKDINKKREYDRKWYHKNKRRRRKYLSKWRKEKRKELKKRLILLLGGKCKFCGYNKSIHALEFHHTKTNKEECVSRLITTLRSKKAIAEAKKCILLCANCHREIGYPN